jgi:hypothetical protein
MDLTEQINSDLKKAILAGDQTKVDTLKSLKNSLQYAEVSGKTKTELDDNQMLNALKKESKKRQEAAEAYKKANNMERNNQELREKEIIDNYLPEQMDESQIKKLVDDIIEKNKIEVTPQNMGLIIKTTKDQAGPSAEGATIAAIVKKRVIS